MSGSLDKGRIRRGKYNTDRWRKEEPGQSLHGRVGRRKCKAIYPCLPYIPLLPTILWFPDTDLQNISLAQWKLSNEIQKYCGKNCVSFCYHIFHFFQNFCDFKTCIKVIAEYINKSFTTFASLRMETQGWASIWAQTVACTVGVLTVLGLLPQLHLKDLPVSLYSLFCYKWYSLPFQSCMRSLLVLPQPHKVRNHFFPHFRHFALWGQKENIC